ncbi:mitochondrial carrier [Hesseltinella vesiculosa]|uniref:Mitochondrial carrier n=1 Tax=Hesseltinella vesiculosa TaxID=101127 RepID=A0A1X2GMW2_9FUNG|nr:mitochondrial carrier [Hesseltinella vesiculosa]
MPSYITNENLSSSQLAFCGAVAGVISRFVVAPLDVVKIRMQLQNHRTNFTFANGSSTSTVKYASIIPSLRTILKEEGIKGWYKGNLPAEYLYLSYSAIEFWTFNELEKFMERKQMTEKLPHSTKTFISGMIAGSVATTITYPFDLLRTRFAVQGDTKHYTGIFQAIKSIYSIEGIRGFYPGIRPAIVQIMPYMGLLFTSYDLLASCFQRLREKDILSSQYKGTHDMISGAVSGVLSKTAVYPIDVVRKRLQVQGPYLTDYVVRSTKYSSNSWWACMKLIVVNEGPRSLYKGLLPSLIKVAPANAVTFLVFEETKKLLVNRSEKT